MLVLRYFEDLTEAQTAEVLGCRIGAPPPDTDVAITRWTTVVLHPDELGWLVRDVFGGVPQAGAVLDGDEPAILLVGDEGHLRGAGRGGQGHELAVRAFGGADGQPGKVQVQQQDQVLVGVVEPSRVQAGGAVLADPAGGRAEGAPGLRRDVARSRR